MKDIEKEDIEKEDITRHLRKALVRLAGSISELRRDPAVALSLLGASITSLTLASDRAIVKGMNDIAKRVTALRKELGAIDYNIETELVTNLIDGKTTTDLKDIPNQLDNAVQKLITILADVTRRGG